MKTKRHWTVQEDVELKEYISSLHEIVNIAEYLREVSMFIDLNNFALKQKKIATDGQNKKE